MINKLNSRIFIGLCTLLMTVTSLYADEEEAQKHVPVGNRAESIEKVREDIKTHAEEVAQKVAVKGKSKKSSKVANVAIAKGFYYTLHPGVYHSLTSMSFFGDRIHLEDGSIWYVASYDTDIVRRWTFSDLLVITPNHGLSAFNYDYKVTNQTTGEAVVCNLELGPIYNGPYTHWIVNINYYNKIVYLEDGSAWDMSPFDSSIVNQWMVNDTVIIGVNDSLMSSFYPNILINVNTLRYAEGAVVH